MLSVSLSNRRIYGKLIFIMCFMYLINFALDQKYINLLYCFIILGVFFLSLFDANKKVALFSLVMFVIGTVCTFSTGKGIEGMIEGIQINMPILALMLLVPLISIPFRLGGYLQPVKSYLSRIYNKPNLLFLLITFLIFFLGPIMSIGIIKILHDIVGDFKVQPKLLAKGYLGAYSTVVIWSPYHSSVALVLYYLNLSISDYLPFALTLSLLFFLLLNLLFIYSNKKNNDLSAVINRIEENHIPTENSLSKLLFLVFFLMAFLIIIEHVFKWPMTFIVTATAVFFPLFWGLIKKKNLEVNQEFEEFSYHLARNSNNEIALFIGAGLFGFSLKGTWIFQKSQHFLNMVYDHSYLLFMIVIILIVCVFTFIGIHQVVIVSALLLQIETEVLGTSAVLLALLFMLSWSISAVTSPVNPLNLAVSHLIKSSGIVSGLKYNGVYLLLMVVTGFLYIYLLHIFIDNNH